MTTWEQLDEIKALDLGPMDGDWSKFEMDLSDDAEEKADD